MSTLFLVRAADEPAPPLGPGDEVAVLGDDGPDVIARIAAHERVIVWGAPVEILDLRGEVCPFTFVRTKLRLEELPAGARLEVLVDHEPASRNVPRSAAAWGQRVLGVAAEPGRWRIRLERA